MGFECERPEIGPRCYVSCAPTRTRADMTATAKPGGRRVNGGERTHPAIFGRTAVLGPILRERALPGYHCVRNESFTEDKQVRADGKEQAITVDGKGVDRNFMLFAAACLCHARHGLNAVVQPPQCVRTS